MSFLKKFTDGLSHSYNQRQEQKKADAELEHKLRLEAQAIERIEYEKAYRERAIEAAKLRAIEMANKKTGIARLRALNAAENIDKPKPSALQKLSEFTRANQMRREENLKKTEMLRQEALKMRQERQIMPRRLTTWR